MHTAAQAGLVTKRRAPDDVAIQGKGKRLPVDDSAAAAVYLRLASHQLLAEEATQCLVHRCHQHGDSIHVAVENWQLYIKGAVKL